MSWQNTLWVFLPVHFIAVSFFYFVFSVRFRCLLRLFVSPFFFLYLEFAVPFGRSCCSASFSNPFSLIVLFLWLFISPDLLTRIRYSFWLFKLTPSLFCTPFLLFVLAVRFAFMGLMAVDCCSAGSSFLKPPLSNSN